MQGSATSAVATPAAAEEARRGLPPGPRTPRTVQTARMVLDPAAFARACRRRFGDTFTVRTLRWGDVVFISDPASLKRLFAADRVNVTTPDRHVVIGGTLGPRSLFVLEGDDHRLRRKLMLPPFHGERMDAYAGVMEEAALREMERWPSDSAFPLHPSMRSITFELILRAVFGIDAAERREELEWRLEEMLTIGTEPSLRGLVAGRLRRVWRGTPVPARAARLLEETYAILAEQIAERRAEPDLSQRSDILSLLLSSRFEDGSAMDDAEVRDQLMTLLVAGHETTATGLAWAFDLLLHHPDKLGRLIDELATEGGGEYLDAVIEETLRVRPVVPQITRQLGAPAVLGGWELPAGTAIAGSIVLAHTREGAFPAPDEFRPERFLESKPETFSWIPFGGGARRCIGAAFALAEMRVVLRTVLGAVRLEAGSPDSARAVRRHITLVPRNGAPAIVRRPI